jgi:hypothetical protein
VRNVNKKTKFNSTDGATTNQRFIQRTTKDKVERGEEVGSAKKAAITGQVWMKL